MNEFRHQEAVQRVGFLAAIPAMLRTMGAKAEEVIAQAGLEPDALANPDGFVSYKAAGQLLMLAAQATEFPSFGLELGKQVTLEALGVVGEYMRHAPTLRAALHSFAANNHRNTHGGIIYLLEEGAQACFGYAIYQPGVPGYSIICDAAAMGTYQLVCQLLGRTNLPTMDVLLAREEPADLKPYREAFHGRAVFNADQTCVALPSKVLDQTVPGADPKLRAAAGAKVSGVLFAGEYDLVTRLRRTVRIALMSGDLSATKIAAQLGMGRRNLDRRLKEENVTYQDVLDETRAEFAQQLLVNTQLSISSIASIVGFSDPSILTRAFIRWRGMTPSAWRQKCLLAEAH